MGCGCNKGRTAARQGGTTPTDPLIYGTDDSSLPTRRVVLVQGSMGIPAGATRYVRGSDVEGMISSGAIRTTGGQ